ncbi:cyclohexanecarboxyl-CoA dehydrogenase [Paracoccus sanguinis]|uniref:Cyclohexanecarboxyl-CoA dehydrogenase n=1 Tax=Paracoccus sanguinis TaxID=1545044 RepID=A0A1H2ST43_9RHOB|nr:cyclohexanecarboxyl-CoA dehydrogenase [Paracoccus sanguinis]KGJ19291.1 acyl-CoA dehydrogenase [Paracoccus sanguinis]SDW34843.1 cyclohexanecarboxyl-CoA dehydrogenase [Paracoccus sanguinis]
MARTVFDTEELDQIRDLARRFAQDRVAPGYLAREKAGRMDMALVREMGQLGLIAPELPEAFGGMGAGTLYAGAIVEEIARADFTFAYVPLLASLNGQILAAFARPEIARDWLTRLTAGKIMLAIALTEPKGGSDAANLGLRMERDGAHYILNGEKTSISANQIAAGTVVFARTGRPEDGARGVSAILVPMDLPGITTSKFDNMGQNQVGHGSIWFDNVRVPAENLLGDEGRGFAQVMQGFDFSRSLIGLQCLGTAQQSLDETWAYIGERRAFGKPLGAFQGVSHQLADFETRLAAARLLSMNALWLKDNGLPHTADAAMTKWWPPLLAYEAIHACILIHGHAGYAGDLPFAQRLKDVLGLQIGDGTAHIMKNIIARERAGRDAVTG